jgi:threonine synthase
MLYAGARVLKVTRGYAEAFDLSREAARRFGWVDRNTGVNPATLEAKKTVAFEIWEQLGRDVPDVVVVPVGDGPTLAALAKGFRELCGCGVAAGVPRLLAVQAEGCQPLKVAWDTGGPILPYEPHTIADGIAVSVPISGGLALREVRESGGAVVTVGDAEMLHAMHQLASHAGILAEPAGAAGLAGLNAARESGLVDQDERAVVLVTGSALKTPQFLGSGRQAIQVISALEEVEASGLAWTTTSEGPSVAR